VSVVMVPAQAPPPREQPVAIAGFDSPVGRIVAAAAGIGGLGVLMWRRRRPGAPAALPPPAAEERP
jgi:hypothetical protein